MLADSSILSELIRHRGGFRMRASAFFTDVFEHPAVSRCTITALKMSELACRAIVCRGAGPKTSSRTCLKLPYFMLSDMSWVLRYHLLKMKVSILPTAEAV